MRIFVINGFPCSGKDTFVDFCLEATSPYGFKISTVDLIKKIARDLGWNGEKDEKNRKFLSDFKDLLTEWNDIPVQDVLYKIENRKNKNLLWNLNDEMDYAFIFSREPEEVERFRRDYNAKTVLVSRLEAREVVHLNHADSRVEEVSYDYYISNNGTLEELRGTAKKFLKEMGLYND